MPEGDTIHYAANRMRPLLVGRAPDVSTPHQRFAMDDWPGRLSGRAVRSVDPHGKHLFLRFEGDLTLHSHLRMTGTWGVYPAGRRWGRSPRLAWLVLRVPGWEVVQFNGPVLELLTESRTRFDRRLAALGPDVLADSFDSGAFLARLRGPGSDPGRGIGDALLDQRVLAGIGNLWKSEACFEAGVDPWRPVARVSDEEALAVVGAARPRMRESARTGHQSRAKLVYRRVGMVCPRCGGRIRSRGQGDDARMTYWCPGCQR